MSINKEKLLQLLKGYENSMTEFEPEEMEYLRALVNFDVNWKTLSEEDVEYWKDHELPEEQEPLEIFKRSADYSAKLKAIMIEDMKAIRIKVNE